MFLPRTTLRGAARPNWPRARKETHAASFIMKVADKRVEREGAEDLREAFVRW